MKKKSSSVPAADSWYSSPRLWQKLAVIARRAGDKIIVTALILFHCLQDKETPAWARTVIIGALGYLILPADIVPDVIPGAGLTDDWGALVAALGTISVYIKDVHKQKAREQTDRLFAKLLPHTAAKSIPGDGAIDI